MGQILGQGILDFYRNANQRGLARDFQFKITNFTVGGISLLPDDLLFLKTATVPSKTINVIDAPFMGSSFSLPGTVTYDGNKNWPVKFYCTQDYSLREFLEQATESTFDIETSTGNQSPLDLNQNTITISLLDNYLNEIRIYQLLGAFVTKVDEINYDTTKSGDVVEVGASIAYQYWVSGDSGGIATGSNELDINLNIGGLDISAQIPLPSLNIPGL